ncbi:MAG: type II toxin-antitoxin system VapC family toxin [Acidobacteriota bacterium]
MILPDVNVLIHAHNQDSPIHQDALRWWQECLAGRIGVGLAWVTLLGFLRISTHRRILASPLPHRLVLQDIGRWLELPHVHIPHPSERHFQILSRFIDQAGTAGNLTTDAHLAALAIDRGYVLHSTDRDFGRFDGLRWINPLH